MKRWTGLVMAMLAWGVACAEVKSGSCGTYSSLTYSFDTETGVLRITGNGQMPEYEQKKFDANDYATSAPWVEFRKEVKTVEIEEGVTTVGSFAFNGVEMTSVKIPSTVWRIGTWAFAHCHDLDAVQLPSGLTKLEESAFYSCSALTSINIPGGVVILGDMAFSYCEKLSNVSIGHGVQAIGEHAFWNCRLQHIALPSSVVSIGGRAFEGCDLSEITIPKSVTTIGYGMLDFCYIKPENIVNESSLTSADNWGAIDYETERPDGLLMNGNTVVSCRKWATVITLPEHAEIPEWGLCGRPFTRINLPSTLTKIPAYAFFDCKYLTEVEIPEGVTYIGVQAFSQCDNLKIVKIPSGVTYIGSRAFSSCKGLKEMHVAATTLPSGDYAFGSCDLSTATLYVPKEAIESYKASWMWNEFGSIKPLSAGYHNDINEDGQVDIQDVNLLIDYILQKEGN